MIRNKLAAVILLVSLVAGVFVTARFVTSYADTIRNNTPAATEVVR